MLDFKFVLFALKVTLKSILFCSDKLVDLLESNELKKVYLIGASFKENTDGTVEMLPLDTHLYMNGTASDEHNEKLIDMSERTCYLHATLCEALEPKININFK